MSTESAVSVEISGQGREPVSGTVTAVEISDGQRLRRALRAAGVLFALGLATLPIPIIHLWLPWLFFLASLIVFARVWRRRTLVRGEAGACPRCAALVALTEQPLFWPIETNCEGCGHSLVIRPA